MFLHRQHSTVLGCKIWANYNCGVSSSSWGKEASEKVRVNLTELKGVLWVLAISLVLRKVVWNLWLESGTRIKTIQVEFWFYCLHSPYWENSCINPNDPLKIKPNPNAFILKQISQRQHQKLATSEINGLNAAFQDFCRSHQTFGDFDCASHDIGRLALIWSLLLQPLPRGQKLVNSFKY